MSRPSGDQTPIQSLLCPNVSLVLAPRTRSITQRSLLVFDASARLTTTRVPSGERETVLYGPGSPTVSRLSPFRLNQVSRRLPAAAYDRYTSVPLIDGW